MNFRGVHSPLLSTSNLCISDVGAEELAIAGKRIAEILSLVQPTEVSEQRRKEIIKYIQRIAEATYGIKVFAFGSVPLKTYLPEGDIDLTAICQLDEEVLVRIFSKLLECEISSEMGLQVTNVKYIPAQVKVIRCCVDNISVDLSFNQIAGLCTLSFLEQVDEMMGEDHLFRRSVILIKAWCFYESRIIGANYGLISTYALETMVVHIINMFHSSLHCPLAVLYKFLQYYTKFNWDLHCVTINGPALISSFPEVVVQRPDDCDDLLITDEILCICKEVHSRSTGTSNNGEKRFRTKFLNVMDPLRDHNNLGKSVNKANFYRIKFAFSHGFDMLRETLMTPREKLNKRVDNFFKTVITMYAKSRTTIHVSPTHAEPRKEGDCSSGSNTIFRPIPQLPALKITPAPATPSLSSHTAGSHTAEKAVASLKGSTSALVNPSAPKKVEENQQSQSLPKIQSSHTDRKKVEEIQQSQSIKISAPKKVEEIQQSQSLPKIQQGVIAPRPALSMNIKQFPTFPSHDQGSGAQNELLSSSSKPSEDIGWGEGSGKGAWNKPLVWELAEKRTDESKGSPKPAEKGTEESEGIPLGAWPGTEESKVIPLGAWKVPLVWKRTQTNDGDGSKDESIGVQREANIN